MIECAGCGTPILADELFCESCDERNTRHNELEEENKELAQGETS